MFASGEDRFSGPGIGLTVGGRRGEGPYASRSPLSGLNEPGRLGPGARRFENQLTPSPWAAATPTRASRAQADRADFLTPYRRSDQRYTTSVLRLPPRADSIS